MKKRIESLTDEQKALLPVYRDKWMKIGLCTEPADRPRAERAIRQMYTAAALNPPKQILWVTSPLAGAIVSAILKDESFWRRVSESSPGPRKAELGHSVWNSVGDSVQHSVGSSLEDAWYGQHDAGYCGFVDYFRQVCKLTDETKKTVVYMDLAQSANWFFPYQNICIVSDRPDIVSMKNGRIHSEIGPAIRYRDGLSVYGLNGVRVQEWIVTTPAEEMNPKQVLALTNVEERLQAIKKMGAHRIIKELNGKTISTKGSEYELFEITLEGSKEKLLRMKNPSEDKQHYEFVEPHIKTVDEALAWRIGWDLNKFQSPLAKT